MRQPALWVTAAAVAMVSLDLGRRILATNDEARLNFDPIVLVSYAADAPRADPRR